MTPHTAWSPRTEAAAPPLDTTLRSSLVSSSPHPSAWTGRPLGCAETPAASARAPSLDGDHAGGCVNCSPRRSPPPPPASSCALSRSQMPACLYTTALRIRTKRAGL